MGPLRRAAMFTQVFRLLPWLLAVAMAALQQREARARRKAERAAKALENVAVACPLSGECGICSRYKAPDGKSWRHSFQAFSRSTPVHPKLGKCAT